MQLYKVVKKDKEENFISHCETINLNPLIFKFKDLFILSIDENRFDEFIEVRELTRQEIEPE